MNDPYKRKLEIGNVIDDTWKYSWYWDKKAEEYNCTWQEIALKDCHIRINELEKKLIDLNNVKKELEETITKKYS